MVIIWLWILVEGHRRIRKINCKLCFLDSCPLQFKYGMVATYIKKIMHNMICATLSVYSREIIQMFLVGQLFRLVKNFNIGIFSDNIYDKYQTFYDGSPRGLTFTWWGCHGLCLRHKLNELAHSFLLCSCVCFCLYGPFNFISFLEFSRQLSVFSLSSSGFFSFQLYISL